MSALSSTTRTRAASSAAPESDRESAEARLLGNACPDSRENLDGGTIHEPK
jgi:hypothetical protein